MDMQHVEMVSPAGKLVPVPVGPHHEPLEAWEKRGYTYPPPPAPAALEKEMGLAPISGTPPIPPPAAVSGQDDVAPPVAAG